MFTVSVKAIYGLCAMGELGLKHNAGPVQIREIAEAHDIPQHYLEQLLVILKKAGLVESFRGAQGGYALARNPSQIQVPEILSALDGKLQVIPEQKKKNSLSFFWYDLQAAIFEHMDISLEDLILRQQNAKGEFIYNI
ncbi:MAG: Rrf2 family transcriptional regulator [Spirochaetales bacterium]|nr:Rrf2 family transcriptional regulator [Spirochaetales bacterium]